MNKYACYTYLKTTLDYNNIPTYCKNIYLSASSINITSKDPENVTFYLISLIGNCWILADRGSYTKDILCYIVKYNGPSIRKKWIVNNLTSATDLQQSQVIISPNILKKGKIYLIIYNGSYSKIIVW